MTPLIMLSLFFLSSAMLMFFSKPLSLGLNLLLMATLASCLIAHSLSSLLALMLFLVYIGGIMMMFAYFIAAAPNTKLITEIHSLKLILPPLLLVILSLTYRPNNFFSSSSFSTDQKLLIPLESPQTIAIITLMFVLLFTMMIIVKIATINAAPMRPFK